MAPSPEPGELIAGFWVWETALLHEAIEWVKRCPLANKADGQIEVRQLYDFGDFDAGDVQDVEEWNACRRSSLPEESVARCA